MEFWRDILGRLRQERAALHRITLNETQRFLLL